ncbi:MAG: CBS domain-containing protein [Chromatiales bacterium]|nr:CBS domain-containing protein [Gammaproteobacteria bacterium]MBW6476958.1 CBS domain-containing protein [Chromatiales bacterium]
MSENYTTLPYSSLSNGSTYHRPPQRLPDRVTADSAATDVMTDFTKVAAITMGPCATLSAAEQRMIASGVRLLLVTDQSNAILGIITSTDLHGDRPLKYLQEVGGKREDIFLRDIMTPADKLEVLYMVDVENAKVGHIVQTMKRVGRQHALVVDLDGNKQQMVRGIFSTKQISKQLGINIDTTEVAKTFAELEMALTA